MEQYTQSRGTPLVCVVPLHCASKSPSDNLLCASSHSQLVARVQEDILSQLLHAQSQLLHGLCSNKIMMASWTSLKLLNTYLSRQNFLICNQMISSQYMCSPHLCCTQALTVRGDSNNIVHINSAHLAKIVYCNLS